MVFPAQFKPVLRQGTAIASAGREVLSQAVAGRRDPAEQTLVVVDHGRRRAFGHAKGGAGGTFRKGNLKTDFTRRRDGSAWIGAMRQNL